MFQEVLFFFNGTAVHYGQASHRVTRLEHFSKMRSGFKKHLLAGVRPNHISWNSARAHLMKENFFNPILFYSDLPTHFSSFHSCTLHHLWKSCFSYLDNFILHNFTQSIEEKKKKRLFCWLIVVITVSNENEFITSMKNSKRYWQCLCKGRNLYLF